MMRIRLIPNTSRRSLVSHSVMPEPSWSAGYCLLPAKSLPAPAGRLPSARCAVCLLPVGRRHRNCLLVIVVNVTVIASLRPETSYKIWFACVPLFLGSRLSTRDPVSTEQASHDGQISAQRSFVGDRTDNDEPEVCVWSLNSSVSVSLSEKNKLTGPLQKTLKIRFISHKFHAL